jgi:replicative DNA helicase
MSDVNQPAKSLTGNKIKPLRPESDFSSLNFGRVMPQAVNMEEAVIGAVMIDKDAMSVVIGVINPESFYLPSHRLIFASMYDLFERSIPIDLLTVKQDLKKKGELEAAGGSAYLAELTNKVASAANLEYHARFVAEKHIQRELIRIGTSTVKDAFEDSKDVFDMLDDAERNLFDITQQNMNRGFESVRTLALKARLLIEELSNKEEGVTGVPTGYSELDAITSGWQKSDLIIVAARPSMGKTALVLCFARNAAVEFNIPVAIFSLEMSSVQLTQRLISMEARISGHDLRNGKIADNQWKSLHAAIDRVGESPIFIDDTPAINIFELRAKCRRLKMQHDIQLIVIDYLQLMSGGPDSKNKGNREQEISGISRALKGLAKELNVPVIALSQLSRAVETRGGNKRPMLSDLRESGAIEQDADIVTFIYRPGYYELNSEEAVDEDLAEIIISKHRNGALGVVNLNFAKEYAVFENRDSFDFNKQLKGDYQIPDDSIFITRESRMNQDDEEIPF